MIKQKITSIFLLLVVTHCLWLSSEEPFRTLEQLKKDSSALKEVIVDLLSEKGFEVIDRNFEIQHKPNLIIVIVNTVAGKKFLKLHTHEKGTGEFNGASLLEAKGLSVIKPEAVVCNENLELIIQPYVADSDKKGGMLWDCIWSLEDENNGECWQILDQMFSTMTSMVLKSLEYSVKPAMNDRLYEERLKTVEEDGISGRLELFYRNSIWNLSGQKISWQELLDKKMQIDGIYYQETLRQLIAESKKVLKSDQKRWLADCHGDWHDMNVCTSKVLTPRSYAFLDCELSGCNDAIGDAMVYLIYTAIQGDYLTPKYYPEQFAYWKDSLYRARVGFIQKKRSIINTLEGSHLSLSNLNGFGTSPIRKKIAARFVQVYFKPLLQQCEQISGEDLIVVDQTVRAALLMRLLAVYDVTAMESDDQTKLLGLLFKSIATPKCEKPAGNTLERFLESL